MKRSVVGVGQKTFQRAGTEDFEITEEMAFVGRWGWRRGAVPGPDKWMRSGPEGQVCSTAGIWLLGGSKIQTRFGLPDVKQPHRSLTPTSPQGL